MKIGQYGNGDYFIQKVLFLYSFFFRVVLIFAGDHAHYVAAYVTLCL